MQLFMENKLCNSSVMVCRFKSGIYYFKINMWKAKEEKFSSINICHINPQNSTEKAELKLKFYHENKI